MTLQASLTRLRPVIRVFVSSTFSDMKHERNALEVKVFPKLEQLCQKNGFQFQAIDLRWGVSTEAGLDHRTMRICFDELRRAQDISPKPNFLILLGNRYGWRPLPEEISVDEFHALEQAASQIPNIAGKSAVVVLQQWYRRDDNAVPPVYLLQSRRQDLGDSQDYTDDVVWNQVQSVLWIIINRAMPPDLLERRFAVEAPEDSPPAIVRFQASATEQEIWHGALRVPEAREHVLAYFREIENLAAFSDPMQIKDFVDVDLSGSVEVTLQIEDDRLKVELRQRLGSANVFCNHAPVRLVEVQDHQGGRTVDVTTNHLAHLCADVESRMSEIIQGQIEAYWHNTAQSSIDRAACELEIEQREYEQFAKERGGEESFVGRQVELQAILDYLENNSPWPLVIHGTSGCGKTALVARASQEVAKTRKRIERFIGVVPRSSDLRSLLSSLCQELRLQNPRPAALPTEIQQLRDEFSQHLQASTPERPLILFLDALDQLDDADNGRMLNWLPCNSLPANVKIVVSCLSDRATDDPAGQPYAELTRCQIPAENFVNLDVLSEVEAGLLLFNRWLPKAGRKVSDDQRARIEQCLVSPACRQPIFLKLLFEEVQLWHSYGPVPVLGTSVPALLEQLFDRLSLPTNHGPLLVNRGLGYLSASQRGLAENEILEILFTDPEYRASLDEATEQTRHELPRNAKHIPIALWSRLRFDLAPYLTERAAPGANVLTFYHRQVAKWVRDHFGKSCPQTWQPHQHLANYFLNQADPEKDKSWKGNSPRPFLEVVFHLVGAQRLDELCQTMCDLCFIEARCLYHQVFELQGDFRLALAAVPVSKGKSYLLEFGEAYSQEMVHFNRFTDYGVSMPFSHFLFQQMRNRIWRNTEGCLDLATDSNARSKSVLLHKRPTKKSRFLRRVEGDVGSNLLRFNGAVRFSPDGRILFIAAIRPRVLGVDPDDGRELFSLNCAGRAVALDFSPEGDRLVVGGDMGSGTSKGFIQVFDIATGQSVVVTQLEVPCYTLVVTVSKEILTGSCSTVHVLDLCTLAVKRTWTPYHNHLVSAIVVNRDRSLVATGEMHDKDHASRISVWDAHTMELRAEIKGPKYGINSLAFSDMEEILVSGSCHLNNGIVAWHWRLKGTQIDEMLLSAQKRDKALALLRTSSCSQQVLEGRVISTLETADTVNSIAFFPRSSFIVAVEGSHERTSDAINVFNIFGSKPGNVGKICGHATIPVAVDIDCHGRWVATLHAKGEVIIWPADGLKEVNPQAPPRPLSGHFVDSACRYVLSVERDSHHYVHITDTETGKNIFSGLKTPCHKAGLVPTGDCFVRFYWDRMPINPYFGSDETDPATRQWFENYKSRTPVCCTLHAIAGIGTSRKIDEGLPNGYHLIENLDLGDEVTKKWVFPPQTEALGFCFSPDGVWGAVVVGSQSIPAHIFCFSPQTGQSKTHSIPEGIDSGFLRFSQNGLLCLVGTVNNNKIVASLDIAVPDNQSYVKLHRGFGKRDQIRIGPLPITGNRFVAVRDQSELLLFESTQVDSKSRPVVFEVSEVIAHKHSSAVFDVVSSKDGRLLVISDGLPSISVFELPSFRFVLRYPMDQNWSNIFLNNDETKLLAIGEMADMNGLHYSLIDFPSV